MPKPERLDDGPVMVVVRYRWSLPTCQPLYMPSKDDRARAGAKQGEATVRPRAIRTYGQQKALQRKQGKFLKLMEVIILHWIVFEEPLGQVVHGVLFHANVPLSFACRIIVVLQLWTHYTVPPL